MHQCTSSFTHLNVDKNPAWRRDIWLSDSLTGRLCRRGCSTRGLQWRKTRRSPPPSDGAPLVGEEQEENGRNTERILLSPAARPPAAPWRRVSPESTSFQRHVHVKHRIMKVEKTETLWKEDCRRENISLVPCCSFFFFFSFVLQKGIYTGGIHL